jgi:hypothetical protein
VVSTTFSYPVSHSDYWEGTYKKLVEREATRSSHKEKDKCHREVVEGKGVVDEVFCKLYKTHLLPARELYFKFTVQFVRQ